MVRRLKLNYFPVSTITAISGFPSARTNLSPFTKDFRGGEQLNECLRLIFHRPALWRGSSQ